MEAGHETEKRIGEIEAWFRERRVTLVYEKVGDPKVVEEWVALMLPDGERTGVVDGGGGRTKLASAENAQAVYRARHGDVVIFPGDGTGVVRANVTIQGPPATAHAAGIAPTVVVSVPAGGAVAGGFPPTEKIEPRSVVHERAVGEPTVEAIPPEVREPLEKIATDYGWLIGAVDEPDGSKAWVVLDREGKTILKSGIADTWDDARIAMIEDLYPPSEEGRG